MNIVFTMAGKYQRFKLFGNKIPKYLIPLGKHTVLWHIIATVHNLNLEKVNLFLIANKNDIDFYPVITSITKDFGINQENIKFINDTKSQLETSVRGLEVLNDQINETESVSFMNIDTVLYNRRNYFETLRNKTGFDGLIDLFPANSSEYSYANTDENNHLVTDVTDKTKISPYACSGLYSYKKTSDFFEKAQSILNSKPNANFTYFYKSIIEEGLRVSSIKQNQSNDTIVLGTPEEYIVNLHRF